MLRHARTFAVVTLFAVVLWIFAESESLGEYSGPTLVRFASDPAGGDGSEGAGGSGARLIVPDQAFDGTINIVISGSKSAIARFEAEMRRGILLKPGMSGIPTVDGRHTVNLLRALQDYTPLSRTGVRIAAVTPQIVDVQVIELVEVQAPVEPVLTGIEVVGEVRVTPDRVLLRGPKSALSEGRDLIRVTARLDEMQARRLPTSGPVKEEVTLIPPAGLSALPGFSMDRGTVTVEFTIRGRSASETLRSIPVQCVLPPVEIGRWNVEVLSEDRFLTADVTGSIEAIERLKAGTEAVIALVSLSSDDLQARIESKEASFVILRGGVVTSRSELQVATPRPTIRLKITPTTPAVPPASERPVP